MTDTLTVGWWGGMNTNRREFSPTDGHRRKPRQGGRRQPWWQAQAAGPGCPGQPWPQGAEGTKVCCGGNRKW